MAIITYSDLASYLRDDSLESDPSLTLVVDLVNDLVEESWAVPMDPIPARVRLLALNVGARAWSWNPATAHLDSITRSVDDASRTERYRTSSGSGSVYLSEDEWLFLQGHKRVRSVRLVKDGAK